MTARELAMTMIQDVLKTTGITATAGIGTNMYLCKIAMDIVAKHIEPDKNGVRIAELDEMSYRKKLWSHRPITDFWRVGKGYAKKLEEHGLYTMGDIARCSIGKPNELYNEELLYKLFGINAELLIDHAWGYEPCTMEQVKAYKPETNSVCSGQVLHCPYDYEKAKLIVKEMTDQMVLDLVDKGLVTDQLVLTIGYDIENLSNPNLKNQYKGEVTIDRADGAPKEPESVVVEYSGLEEQQVPQTYHVDNGSRSYDLSLSDVQFAAGAPQTLTIDYTDPTAPTPPQVYVAEIDGVETTFTLASMEQTSDYSWRDVDFTTVWYGRQLADFYLGKIQPDSPAIPFDSANPRYAGYEAVLLQYLGLDADTYRIVDSEWRQLDEPWQNTLRHTGVYHAQRYAASWRATYTTASGTYDAVATYSALAEEAPAIATADYAEVRAAPASVLPIVVLSCLGALLVALVIVLVLVILKKRHRDSGESKQ